MTGMTTVLNPPRDRAGKYTPYGRTAPETTLASARGSLADAVERNADIFHPARAGHPDRYSRAVTVAGDPRFQVRIQLVWGEQENRFNVNAWFERPLRANHYGHVSDLPFDDARTRELCELIQTEAGATPEVVDELAAAFRALAVERR